MTTAESAIIQANKAHEDHEAIIQAKMNVAANYLMLGKLFREVRDLSLYKFLGYDDFNDYIGSPEVAFSRSKVYGLIQIHDLYVERLRVSQRDLLEVGNAKLLMLAPILEKDSGNKDEWIGKAKALSKSDLAIEIKGQAAGDPKGPLSSGQPPQPPPSARPNACCVCGASEWEKNHFPVSRGAGCPEHWWIPLCRTCHTAYHANPSAWTWEWRRKWAEYLYDVRRGEA